MPAIVSGLIMLWEVDWECTPPVVNLVDSKQVSIYVADGEERADSSVIIGRFILDHEDDDDREKLLEAMRDGLLQFIEVSRVDITPPAVPPHTHTHKKKGMKKKGTKKEEIKKEEIKKE